jgi:YYY domain-containing protein
VRDILAWVITVEAFGLAALPLLRLFFGNRRDAALLSRPVGLALVAYLAWAGTLLPRIPFDRRMLLIALAAAAAASWAIDRKTRARKTQKFWGTEDSRGALWFWCPVAFFLIVRAAVPEILGAEKFMDLAFFNSIARHGAMPPLDPWMAGKTINYYYWGYLLAAALAKLASVSPFVSYNLAVATFAGYSFTAAAALGSRLSGGRTLPALASGVAVVFAGNVVGALDALKAPFDRGFDYWHASRVIGNGDTINEFPFFTFFHADLHPHLLAFAYFLAAFVFAHRLFERELPPPEGRGPLWKRALPWLLTAFVAGTAIAANTWNLPALAIALVAAGALRGSGAGREALRFRPLLLGGLAGAATAIAALHLFKPYSRTYSLPYNGLGWTTQKSGLVELFGVWGFFFAVAIASLWPAAPADEKARRRRDLLLSAAAGLSLLASLVFQKPAFLPILFLACLAASRGLAALRTAGPGGAPDLFPAFLLVLALGMIAGCELIYFKDSYGDQLQRMNTIFKFYIQAWPLFAVAAVVFAAERWRELPRRAPAFRALTGAAAVAALLYPANAAISRLRQREGPFTLDAMSALARRSPGDAAAVAWLERNASARSIVLEATGDPYRDFARISSHTGLPTVMGWANHEGLWRGNDPDVNARAQLVKGFYGSADEETAWEIARKFAVDYVVVGDLERESQPNAGRVANFLFLEKVLPGPTAIFKVRRPS